MVQPLEPIYTAALFAPLYTQLIKLLRGLDDDDWQRPTIAGSWRVRDVAGHLLDIDLRKLSGGRDRHSSSARPASLSYLDIVAFINDQNAGGVAYANRISRQVTIDLLEVTGRWVADFVTSLAPHEDARISVLWAGEERSANWMDIGREYTSVGTTRCRYGMRLVRLTCSTIGGCIHSWTSRYERCLPPTAVCRRRAVLRSFDVRNGDSRHAWTISRGPDAWDVCRGSADAPAAVVTVDGDTAWKLLFNALSREEALRRITITGDEKLIEPILAARSVMV